MPGAVYPVGVSIYSCPRISSARQKQGSEDRLASTIDELVYLHPVALALALALDD